MKTLALVFALAFVISGCGAQLTPAAAVADTATKAIQSASVILKTAQTAHAQTNPMTGKPVVSTVQLDQIALAADKLGRIGSLLSKTITDYQAARAAGASTVTIVAAIQALVGDAMSALNEIGKSVPNGTVAAIDQAVASAFSLYAQIRAAAL